MCTVNSSWLPSLPHSVSGLPLILLCGSKFGSQGCSSVKGLRMKSPFEAPVFISSKPYFFELKRTQPNSFSHLPACRYFPDSLCSFSPKIQSPANAAVLSQEEEKQKANIHLSWSVFSPKTESSLLCRFGGSRAPVDVQRMEAFTKLLVCSQGHLRQPKSPELSYRFQI